MEFYQLVLGLTRVPGPRILVRVTEGRRPDGVLAPTAQASDLNGIVGELWAAGAEGVTVNGRRIPAATGFSVDAEGITAGVFRLRPPSEIQAIRNTEWMRDAHSLRGGVMGGLQSVGVVVDVLERDTLHPIAVSWPAALPPRHAPSGRRAAYWRPAETSVS